MTLTEPTESESSIVARLAKRTAVSPAAWKPGEQWDNTDGELTTPALTERIDEWQDILTILGYDPQKYEIVEPVKVSSWEQSSKDGTQQLYSYKAGIRVKNSKESINYDDLVREIKKHRALKAQPEGDTWLVVCIADTQFGKSDGDGLKGTIERFQQKIDLVEQHIKNLRKCNIELGHLLILGLGDIIEGCDGNYASQTFMVEANRREQIRIARRLIRDAIARWSKLFNNVVVSAVPGNHGQNRKDGQAFTGHGDNDDVAVFEVLAEIFNYNPQAYGHVKFHLPSNEIWVSFDCDSYIVGAVHGHITKGGGTPQSRIKDWWEDQAFGEQPIGNANLLLSAHYHHTSLIQHGKKTHIQCPAMDGGSDWWRDLAGADSPSGILTLTVNRNGWDNLKVL